MKILNYLIPKPLRKLDVYLLQRYPIIWETKIHYVLFFSAVVANAVLGIFSLAYSARELSLIPYDSLIATTWGWGFLFATLAILFYAYQQSFVRIKNYTLRENTLRYGLYILGVSSIMLNTLTLPNLLIYRVNQLYSYSELERDVIELHHLKYLGDLIKEVDNLASADETKLQHWQLIQKLPLNQNQAYEKMIAFRQEVKALFNSPDEEDKIDKVKQHPVWHPDLKTRLIDNLQYENAQTSEERANNLANVADMSLLLMSTQRDVAKYLPKLNINYGEYDARNYINRDLAFQLANLIAYKKADFFLTSSSPAGLENRLAFHYILNTLRNGVVPKNHSFKDYEYEQRPNEGNLDKEAMILAFNSQAKVDNTIRQVCNQVNIEQHYTFQASAFLALFLALLVLSAKIFTLRNLIISGFLMFGSLFVLAFAMTSEFFYIGDMRRVLFQAFDGILNILGISLYNIHHRPLFLSWLVPLLIMAFSLGVASYVQLKKINFRWIPLLWTFVITSAMVSTAVTSFFLLLYSHIAGRDYYYNALLTQIQIIYPILALAMFGMYALYNQIAIFPQKK
jgi:hypothetical protein